MTLYDALGGNPLFRDLNERDIKLITEMFPLRIKTFLSGQMVLQHGEECRHLLLLVEGTLVAGMQSPDGKSIIVERLNAPQAAASAIVFSDNGTLPVTLTAESDVRLVSISQEILLQIFQRFRPVLVRYLTDMGNKVSFLAEKIRYLQMKSLRQKLISYIRDLHIKQKTSCVEFDQTMETLAEMFGVARPSLSRELSQLIDLGYLTREGKRLRLIDPSRLLSLLNEE